MRFRWLSAGYSSEFEGRHQKEGAEREHKQDLQHKHHCIAELQILPSDAFSYQFHPQIIDCLLHHLFFLLITASSERHKQHCGLGTAHWILRFACTLLLRTGSHLFLLHLSLSLCVSLSLSLVSVTFSRGGEEERVPDFPHFTYLFSASRFQGGLCH